MVKLSPRAQVYTIFTIVVITAALGSLTQTAMNSMLEGVGADFGVSESIGQWVTTIYMLMVGITVPSVTYLTHRFSLRGVVLLSLGILFAGSTISGLAPNFAILLVGRVLQAIATGITLPMLQTIAMTRFPTGQNGTAMGIGGIAMGFAPNIGPLIGGIIIESWSWRAFYVPLTVAAVLLFVATALFGKQDNDEPGKAHLETPSLVLSTLGFGGLLFGFSNASSMALSNVLVWLPVVLGAVFLVFFFLRQAKVSSPLINLEIFKSARYCACFAAQGFLYASFMGITLVVPLYIQGAWQGSAYEAGLVFVPATILAVIFNPVSGFIADKIGSRKVCVCAAFLLTIGATSMMFLNENSPLWLIMLLQSIRGLGVSTLIPPITAFGLTQLPRKITIDGSAFVTATRQAFASLGTALMVLLITQTSGAQAAALPYQAAFGLSALFALATLICVLWKVR